jgi:tripartite-type tricarboxylate transporter receptor subunit TctC
MAYGSLRSTRAHWLKDKKVRVLFQYSFRRHPELQDVPTVIDLAKNDDQRSVLRLVFAQTQMGRSIFGPPGMAPDRLAIHRAAFKAAMQDKELLADAARSKLEIYEPMPGEQMEKLVGSLYQSPPELLKRAREAMLAAEDRKSK